MMVQQYSMFTDVRITGKQKKSKKKSADALQRHLHVFVLMLLVNSLLMRRAGYSVIHRTSASFRQKHQIDPYM